MRTWVLLISVDSVYIYIHFSPPVTCTIFILPYIQGLLFIILALTQ